ncbi:MAG: Mfa1 family fimbria major subunit [Dysgonomonas sp.]
MKRTKLFLIAAIALIFGFSACNNQNETDSLDEQKANTNVSVTLSMSLNSTAKALPTDYNEIGEWAGRDKIEKVTIYIVDGTSVSANIYTVGTGANDGYTQEPVNGSNQVILKPKKAIKTSSGIKKVYVLINGKSSVEAALAATPADAFEGAYKTAALTLENSGTSLTVSTSADKLATKNGTTDETIVMTNQAEVTINVAPNVSEDDALKDTNPLNRATVQVERAVARVMVTTASETYQVKSGADVLGAISNITWVLAQGENSFYIQRKADYATPNFTWVPANNADYYNNANSMYDYSGLFETYNKTTQFGGTPVATMANYDAADPYDQVTDELKAKLSGKFILPNTHAFGVAELSKYKKGNTAYVLVRAKFTPSVFADGEIYTTDADFYVGANGKFYVSSANALNPAKGGVANQTVAKYVGGKVLYYAWVNPDDIYNWYNSPVIRNNVYHIHISGFKNLGTNWNPLYPEDPNNPNPLNPDPKPQVPGVNEPENPIDPTDPLTTPETWMSVDVKVLPWTLHSYSIDLGI